MLLLLFCSTSLHTQHRRPSLQAHWLSQAAWLCGQWWLNRAHIMGISSTRPQLHGLQGTVGILWPLWLILVSVLSSPGHQPTAMFLLTWSCVAVWTQALWLFSTWSPFNPPSSAWNRAMRAPGSPDENKLPNTDDRDRALQLSQTLHLQHSYLSKPVQELRFCSVPPCL